MPAAELKVREGLCAMKHNETTVRVRYKDTDQMGVAYYANYFVWFEVGRCEYFRGVGDELQGSGAK